jgi:hypothetical protein
MRRSGTDRGSGGFEPLLRHGPPRLLTFAFAERDDGGVTVGPHVGRGRQRPPVDVVQPPGERVQLVGEQVSSVMLVVVWPSCFCTALTLAPSRMSSDAAVCRRS